MHVKTKSTQCVIISWHTFCHLALTDLGPSRTRSDLGISNSLEAVYATKNIYLSYSTGAWSPLSNEHSLHLTRSNVLSSIILQSLI